MKPQVDSSQVSDSLPSPRLASNSGKSLAFKLFAIWLLTNVAVWYAPDIYESVNVALRERELDWIASYYERRSIPVVEASSDSYRLNYLFYAPPESTDQALPLVIFLHGSGGRGNDLRSHLKCVGTGLVDEGWQSRNPSYVATPQCPPEMHWRSERPFNMLETLDKMIDEIERDVNIDKGRVYLIGFSMGGYGCWSFGAHSSERFAAMIPVAGGGLLGTANLLTSVPIWAVHGADDRTIPVTESQEMVAAINEAGGRAQLSILPDVGHGSWCFVQETPNKYLKWMFQQKKRIQFVD